MKKTKSAIFNLKRSTKKFFNKLPGNHGSSNKHANLDNVTTDEVKISNSNKACETMIAPTPNMAFQYTSVQPPTILIMPKNSFDLIYEDTTQKLETLNKVVYENVKNIVDNGKNLELLEKRADDLNRKAQEFTKTTKNLPKLRLRKLRWIILNVVLPISAILSIIIIHFIFIKINLNRSKTV